MIGFGGSRGAAKSGAVQRIALSLAGGKPGVIVWIIRRIWDDLNKDHVKTLFAQWPELKRYWHAMDHELRLPAAGGESSIFFIHAGDSGRAKRKARGPQAHYIFLEQAEEFSQEEMEQLAGSNRAPGTPPGVCKRIFTFNPGGQGTNYLRRIFHLREYHNNERPGNFLFIQGFGWDNYEWFRGLGIVSEDEFYNSREWNAAKRFQVFIEQTDFGRNLNQLPPGQRIGELMGSFDQFSGQYYSEVWEESATVLPAEVVARMIQPWWRRWVATDWGFSHYASTGWFASGLLAPGEVEGYFGVKAEMPVRVILQYRELLCQDVPEPDLARLIIRMTPEAERREVRDHWIGHDAWAKRGSANTVVEQMEPILCAAGMPRLSRADIDRVGGWRLLYNCWASARRLRRWGGPGMFSDVRQDAPALFISAACVETQKAVPMLIAGNVSDGENPQDVVKMAGQAHDDVADMLRYGLKSYLAAEPNPPGDIVRAETWNKYQDPTSRAIAMLRLTAEQERARNIHRRRRA